VLLLDEPTVGVDPQSRERIFEAVTSLAAEGASILYSTHDMDEAERLCSRVILLDEGQVVASGTPAELVRGTGMTPVIRLRMSVTLPDGWNPDIFGARVLERSGAELALAVADAAAVPTLLMSVARAGGDVLDLRLHRPNLADVFFQLTGRALRDRGDAGAVAGA
jgi:ABC-2 type transport system ATP-binding protein